MQKVKDSPAGAGHFVATIIDTFWAKKWFQFIKANPNLPWNFYELSRNPNITWDIVQANLNKPWEFLLVIIKPSHNMGYRSSQPR